MEAKAPEEIYLLPDDRNPNGLSISWYEAPYCTGAIEYTRTDVFIDKAYVKLKKLMYDSLMFQGRLHRGEVIDNFVEDFKNYMKGEYV